MAAGVAQYQCEVYDRHRLACSISKQCYNLVPDLVRIAFCVSKVALESCHARHDDYFAKHRWRGFKDWVKETQPQTAWLSVSKLKARSTIEATACNPTTISASFNKWRLSGHIRVASGAQVSSKLSKCRLSAFALALHLGEGWRTCKWMLLIYVKR